MFSETLGTTQDSVGNECTSTDDEEDSVAFPVMTRQNCRDVNSCSSNKEANCVGTALVYINTITGCHIADCTAIMLKATALIPGVQLSLYLRGDRARSQCVASFRKNVVVLSIQSCSDKRTTSWPRDFTLANLETLFIQSCEELEIRKMDFSASCKLRYIAFYLVTFTSIEKDSFTNLPELKHLQLESYGGRLRQSEVAAWISRLHCHCDYSWFRRWLKGNPRILASKTIAQTLALHIPYDSVDQLTAALPMYGTLFVPVDCASFSPKYFTHEAPPSQFTVNDPCI